MNRDKIDSASKAVRVGDVLTVALERRVLVLEILGLGTRRGPAPEAQLLYKDLTPPPAPADQVAKPQRVAARDPGSGRPTKRDRRRMDAFTEFGGSTRMDGLGPEMDDPE